MLETRSQKDNRKWTRWIWRKKRTDTDHDESEQIQSKLPKISMMMMTTKFDIPNDIVIEILSRLPGKSLLQFKWACKYWYDLITKDSSFAKLQLGKYAINNPLLMLSSYSEKTASLILSSLNCTKLVEVDGLIDEGSYSPRSLLSSVTRLFKSHSKGSVPTVVGSCNGLFCMSKQTRDALNHVIGVTFCIWNPCTNEFKESSLEHMEVFPEGKDGQYYFYGFGYDQTIDDYKVISNTVLRTGDHYVTVVQVYTLGTNSWKRIGNHHPFRLCSTIKFVPNVASFYCIGGKSSLGSFMDVILCFDIAKEEYREISKPWFVRDLPRVQLIELDGCLCIAQNAIFPKSPGVEVWMVKDYCHDGLDKNEYSWTKLYTISQPRIQRSGFQPLGIFNKNNGGEILLQLLSEQNLVWYNEKDDKICKTLSLEVCGSVTKIEAYVENLVSLNSGTYMRLEEEEQTITRKHRQRNSLVISCDSLKKKKLTGNVTKAVQCTTCTGCLSQYAMSYECGSS